MPEPRTLENEEAGLDDQRDVKIRYKRYHKARMSDSSNFLPIVAAIFALIVLFAGWFFWRIMVENTVPPDEKETQTLSDSDAKAAHALLSSSLDLSRAYFVTLPRKEYSPGEKITVIVIPKS
ncbi:MAG: hypothetical protein LBT23_10245 [Synergistaceae bacterium]|nr:hypothetical protein [Synergistaceae bacterium]